MTMEWTSRNGWFEPNGGNDRESFEVHDERMREFRRSHADVATVNGPRLDEATLLERMESLQGHHAMMEMGGSAFPNEVIDRSALGLMRKVARYKLSQN